MLQEWERLVKKNKSIARANGTTVVFYSDQAVRPVSSVNVYDLKVSWTLENVGGQNIRKYTFTLQETQ